MVMTLGDPSKKPLTIQSSVEESELFKYIKANMPEDFQIEYTQHADVDGISLYQRNEKGIAISDGKAFTVIVDTKVSEEAMAVVVKTLTAEFERKASERESDLTNR